MSTKHTPGPWAFSEDSQFGDTRFYVAQQEGAPYTPDYSDVATLIAETCSGDRVAVQQANARLIAKAPELLAEIEREYAELADVRNDWPGRHTLAGQAKLGRLRDLIASATGREPQDVQDDYGTRIARATGESAS